MHIKKRIITGGVIVMLLSACATPYTTRPIVMQGPGFDEAAYAATLEDCRHMALKQTQYAQAGDAAMRTIGAAVLGTALGAALGATVGRAGLGGSVGMVSGAAVGLGNYGQLTDERQGVFHSVLAQCLAMRGYQVLGVGQ